MLKSDAAAEKIRRLPLDSCYLSDFSSPEGEVRIVDSRKFLIASTVAAAHVIVHPGAMRELHWHPNADE